MTRIVLAVLLALAAPAWAEGPYLTVSDVWCDPKEGLILHDNDVVFRFQPLVGQDKYVNFYVRRSADDPRVFEVVARDKPLPYFINIPDMNGDGTIDKQDKRLAEYAVEEFRRNY